VDIAYATRSQFLDACEVTIRGHRAELDAGGVAHVDLKEEASGCRWFILSAEYGLVARGRVIAPFERTLNTTPVAEHRAWAGRVSEQLTAAAPELSHVVFLAGERYREFLGRHLTDRGVAVSVPMEGLRIGEQVSWLGRYSPPPLG